MRILIHSHVLYQVRASNIYMYNEISIFLLLHLTHLMYSQSHYTPVSAVKNYNTTHLRCIIIIILALKSKSSEIISHFACKYKHATVSPNCFAHCNWMLTQVAVTGN